MEKVKRILSYNAFGITLVENLILNLCKKNGTSNILEIEKMDIDLIIEIHNSNTSSKKIEKPKLDKDKKYYIFMNRYPSSGYQTEISKLVDKTQSAKDFLVEVNRTGAGVFPAFMTEVIIFEE